MLNDFETLVRNLTDEQRARVVKAVGYYLHNGNEKRVLSDLKGIERIVFNNIKSRLDRYDSPEIDGLPSERNG